MKKLMTVLVAVSGVLLCAQAADLYVSPSGNDSNTGADQWEPLKTINAALEKLGAEGGTIYLADGTYDAEIPHSTENDLGDSALILSVPVVIESLSGDPSRVTLKRDTSLGLFRAVYLNHPDAVLRNLTISGFTATSKKAGGGVYIGSAGGLIDHCVITGCKAGAESRESGGGGVCMIAGRVTRSVIEKCQSDNMRQYGSGIYATAGVIEQCIVRECKTTHHATACNGSGAVAIKGSAVLINSVVVNNTSCLATGVFVDDLMTGGVFNTVVYDNKLCGSSHTAGCTRFNGIFCARMGNTTLFPSLVKNKTTISHCAVDSEPYDNTCIQLEASPFLDYANKDYTIPEESPLVDGGNTEKATAYLTSAYDCFGNNRISGTHIDIGIHEIQKAGLYISDVTASSDIAVLPDDAEITFTVSGFSSTGNISYIWDFGDGTAPVTVEEAVVSHTYSIAGSYKVTVTATNENGSFEYTYPNVIGVSGLSVSYTGATQGREGVPVSFVAEILASSDTVTFTWDFGDETEKLVTTDTAVTHAYAAFGQYTVKVSAVSSIDAEITYVFPDKVKVVRNDLYVTNTGSNTFPYDTWEKAATAPQTAIDSAVDGCTVHLAPITYNVQNKTVSVNKSIVLCGEGETPEDTILDGRADGDGGSRNLSVNAEGAFVKNLMLYRGYAGASPGGGNLALYNGTVSNCVLSSGRTRNSAAEAGGAKVMGGLLTHCVITNAYNGNRGAGICLVQTAGRVSNCLITHNKKQWDSSRNNISLCAIQGGLIDNCTIKDCWLLKYNPNKKYQMSRSDYGFEVSAGARAYNLTIANLHYDIPVGDGEDAEELKAAAYAEQPRRWAGTAASFVNCATDDATPINDTCLVGTLEKNSLFADYTAGDFTPGAVTKNKGVVIDGYPFPSVDLLGNPRVQQKAIDIGCYEVQPAKGITILIR